MPKLNKAGAQNEGTFTTFFNPPIPYKPHRMVFISASFRSGTELHEPILSAKDQNWNFESHYHHTWSNKELIP